MANEHPDLVTQAPGRHCFEESRTTPAQSCSAHICSRNDRLITSLLVCLASLPRDSRRAPGRIPRRKRSNENCAPSPSMCFTTAGHPSPERASIVLSSRGSSFSSNAYPGSWLNLRARNCGRCFRWDLGSLMSIPTLVTPHLIQHRRSQIVGVNPTCDGNGGHNAGTYAFSQQANRVVLSLGWLVYDES